MKNNDVNKATIEADSFGIKRPNITVKNSRIRAMTAILQMLITSRVLRNLTLMRPSSAA